MRGSEVTESVHAWEPMPDFKVITSELSVGPMAFVLIASPAPIAAGAHLAPLPASVALRYVWACGQIFAAIWPVGPAAKVAVMVMVPPSVAPGWPPWPSLVTVTLK